ncbi:hypothetical protein ACFQ67_00520 [Streptomyces sp. NPDC056488]|uniref:hypothetical protein n=1 Tax=Streptomyces sp. NPDC056488 TaxID=3345836 RepID=UPI0036A390AF
MTRTARAAREQARLDRRGKVDNLLARHARTSPTEAAHLRALLDAEFAEGDRYRRESGGQQAAVRRAQERLAAAERAIVELEAERDRLARDVEVMHDGINQAAREAFAERKKHRAAQEAIRQRYEQQLAEQARAHAAQLGVRTRTVNVWAQDARESRQEQRRVEALAGVLREQLAAAEAALAERQP